MTRMVQCVVLKTEAEGLDKPPHPGSLGTRIYENVSQEGWDAWIQHSVILINHYGLNFADPRASEFMREQMEEFFFGGGGAPITGGAPGKGAPQK